MNGKYQLAQAAVTITANLSVALLIAVMLSWFYLLAWDGHGVMVYNHNRMVPIYLICAAILISMLSLLWSLRRSRAIAGMIKKIDNTLAEASHGIFPDRPVKFRKGDHFTSLAVSLNRCLKQLRKRGSCSENIIPTIEGLMKRIESGAISNKEIYRHLDGIVTKLEED